VILVHGRGATAESILTLADEFEPGTAGRSRLAYLAPQASGNTWYPYSFLPPIPQNEPGISSGIALLAGLVEELAGRGIPHQRLFLGGFSQGACLALEFGARHARRYGGVFGYSGDVTMRLYPGLGHTVNQDEIDFVRQMIGRVAAE
jgi:predicted esterase